MTNALLANAGLALALGLMAGAAPAAAADTSCAAVAKAAAAALAQPRIHAAVDAPLDPEALKMGMKPTLMHSIVIGQTQYSNALTPNFRKTVLESADLRMLATDLGPFMVESGCKSAGNETLAGRAARIYTASGDLGRGEARIRLWIAVATGLPLRAVTDEPEVDVDAVFAAMDKKKGRPGVEVREKANGKRVIATHAYVFGDSVKPPGPKGAVEPAMLASLQALLRGTP